MQTHSLVGSGGSAAKIRISTKYGFVIGLITKRDSERRSPPNAPPRKSLVPKPRGPPRTPPELRSLKLSISFRADQKVNLDRLKADHRLSLLCQQAVDLDAELEDLSDGVRDDALEAAAASLFDEWCLSGSYAISQDGGPARSDSR